MLDIVRRIATRLKEGDEPERGNAKAPKVRDGGSPNGKRPPGLPALGPPWPARHLCRRHKSRQDRQVQVTAGASKRSEPTASAHSDLRPEHKKDERGFTIPEMLVTAVLVTFASGLIATAIHQIFIVAQDGNARLAVLGDVENAAIWIGRDTSESASWSAGSGTVYGTLTTGDPLVQYRYSYDAASTSLVREHLVSGSPVSTLRIARRIANQGDVSFSVTGTLLTVSITGTRGPTSESATLKLGMRVK